MTIASTLKMQIWIATNNRDVPRVMKTESPATVMVKVSLKVNTKVYLDVLKSVLIPWYNQVADPGCGSRTRRRPTSPKRPRLGFRSATTLYPSLSLGRQFYHSTLHTHTHTCVCVCKIHVLFNFGLNLCIKFFSFI